MKKTVKVIKKTTWNLPKYETKQAAGMDLRTNIEESYVLKPLERHIFPTGLFIQLPKGTEAQIRPRSGLACKHGVTVVNSPGTIDADYTGEVKVCLINLSNEEFEIKPGDRIAQMVISSYTECVWDEVDKLDETERGDGGFGHTGK